MPRVALLSLYVSFATLQGLDAHSTLRAPQFGGFEVNPILGGVVARPPQSSRPKRAPPRVSSSRPSGCGSATRSPPS
jgi:hypothetical protein